MTEQVSNEARRRRARGMRSLIAILAVIAVFGAACGSGGTDDAGPDQTGPGGTGVETGGADPDGRVRVAYNLVASMTGGYTWDPAEVATVVGDDGLFYLVYGRLMRPSASGELVPDLAESAEIVDADTIEIKVRPGVTFSDGTPLDAEAVKSGLDRTVASGNTAGLGESFFNLESTDVVDDGTVRLTISGGKANDWFDTFMGSWQTTIVKPGETDFSKPTGAGPMTVTAYQPEKSMTLDRSASYWDAESIRIGGVDLLGVNTSDDKATANALAAGQVDMASITTDQIAVLGGDLETTTFDNPNRFMSLQLCKTDGPLADPRVRTALSKAIDREAINDAIFDGSYTIARGLWPDGHRFHDPSIDPEVEFDPEAAQQLLADAGYEAGFTFDVYVLFAAQMGDVAQVLQQQLSDVGITMNIVPAPDYVNQFLLANAPGAGLAAGTGPNRQKLDQWSGATLGNACQYSDPELDALRAQLQAVSDSDPQAAELWHEIERKVVVDDALGVFILFASNTIGFDPDVLGDASVMPALLASPLIVPDPRTAFVKAAS